eukprot:6195757-Alexandrium_andersonii.AAC.1
MGHKAEIHPSLRGVRGGGSPMGKKQMEVGENCKRACKAQPLCAHACRRRCSPPPCRGRGRARAVRACASDAQRKRACAGSGS